ncbi:MAG: MFS transporter [Phycisphaeraceae bacterium]|nr:MFS transporter [Phycisphaeraceae bacterium]
MRNLSIQYFLVFTVLGALTPFVPVFLASSRGMNAAEVGYVLSAASLAPILSPVIITFLADAALSARVLIGLACLTGGVCLAGMLGSGGFWPTLIFYCLFSLVYLPLTPVQDGFYFALSKHRAAAGLRTRPYHRIRVWGTVGFILPGVVLWALLQRESLDPWMLLVAMGFAGLALGNSFTLPVLLGEERGRKIAAKVEGGEESLAVETTGRPESTLPTVAALRVCLQKRLLIFFVAMFLTNVAAAMYYGFYPIYLKTTVGFGDSWLGVIADVGVVVEIFFMLAFGRMVAWLGLKRYLVMGVGCMTLRMLFLAVLPCPLVAVGTQLFHGVQVVSMHVAPPVYLDRHAQDHYRSSIQGLFSMVVIGLGRLGGNILGGQVAMVSLQGAFYVAAGLCVLATLLLAFYFREQEVGEAAPAGG